MYCIVLRSGRASLLSQAEALWESKLQIAGLACQDTRYKGPVYQTERLYENKNQSTHNFRDREVTLSCDTYCPTLLSLVPRCLAHFQQIDDLHSGAHLCQHHVREANIKVSAVSGLEKTQV